MNTKNTALIMIDMQNGFIDESSSLCIAQARASIPACAKALEFARNSELPIFHVRREYAADGSDVEPVRKAVWLEGGKPLTREGYDPKSIYPPEELEALPGETIIFKPRFSAFFDTDLDERLKALGVTSLMLIGTTTPNCIRTTCYDALSLNYDVTIVEDATSSRTSEVQKANIEDMAFIGAHIVKSTSL